MTNKLCTISEASELILTGAPYLAAGSAEALASLPKGKWIGGTTPYFMSPGGCLKDDARVFLTELPLPGESCQLATWGEEDIDQFLAKSPEGSTAFLVLPAFSGVHRRYAEEAGDFPGMFLQAALGWVSGVALESLGSEKPAVFLGETGESWSDRAVVLYASFPDHRSVKVDIVNLFHQGHGPVLRFSETGFSAKDCLVDGQPDSLSDYIVRTGIDTKLPLVADFGGAQVNTSIAKVDGEGNEVGFYAPVFAGVDYRFAEPVGDYATQFRAQAPSGLQPLFSCNCILNYLYGDLEGKDLASLGGPITFGEVAYQLLNQTMVYAELTPAA